MQLLPASAKRYIAENNIRFYTCDAVDIAVKLGLGARRTNTVLQAAFFKLSEVIPIDKAVGYMKEAIQKTYGRKGEDIVAMNCEAVDAGITHVHQVEVPEAWKNAVEEPADKSVETDRPDLKQYVEEILIPDSAMEGDSIPVSRFVKTNDGMIPSGTAAFEKRGVAISVPKWIPENCLQCNMCSFVCPHGAIRPFAVTEDEAAKSGAAALEMKGKDGDGRKFALAISSYDCAGCVPVSNPARQRTRLWRWFPSSLRNPRRSRRFSITWRSMWARKSVRRRQNPLRKWASGSRIWNSRVRARDAVSRLMQSW